MSSVAFYTLGCKVNFYDTEAIWQLFKNEAMNKSISSRPPMFI
ncbi:MiaB family protein [Paenibacillus pini JCM 16418]|uniref:MiaB family protein n=1 Tax=Paenibacillus pini JCM 16418 TaxID=1236976 RepID=W7YX86_9BACL|nr:MiaB family protein [Paenibacillus pini JCM 16418]